MLKNNKVRKILSLVLIATIALSIILAMTTIVNAAGESYDPLKPIEAEGSEAIPWIQGWGGKILGVFQAVGMSVAVIILVWLGIKYIMASPDGKAEIKKQAFAYIVGAVLLFGATVIIEVIKNFANQETTDTSSVYIQTIEDVQKS